MTLRELLTETRSAGIQLEARGDRLHVEAPQGTVSDALRAELKRRKAELLPVVWRLAAMRQLAIDARGPPSTLGRRRAAGPVTASRAGIRWKWPDAYGRCVPCDIASDLYYSTRDDAAADAEVA
jgi:hypothetical protein